MKKQMTMMLMAAGLGAALLMTGCHKETKTAAAPSTTNKVMMGAMNDKCPISGQAVNKDVKTSAFEGKTIGFCCGMCEPKWNAMSTADKEAWMAKNMKK